MELFIPPKTDYKKYYEQGAFNLTWKISMFMLFSFPFLLITGAMISLTSFLIGVVSFLFPFGAVLWLRYSKKYEVVAIGLVLFGASISGIVLNMRLLIIPVVEFVFMLNTIFFAFITLRRIAGLIVMFVQFVWILIFVFTQPASWGPITVGEGMILILPLLVAFSLFAFLVVAFLQQRKESEQKYAIINSDLNDVNELVNSRNKEKTVMLKEIHHRVKNNLQVISSLLRLQSYEIEDEDSKAHFQNAVHRVAAMALIHEKMYQNENLSKINLKSYVDTLAADLVRNHAQGIEIKLNVYSEIEDLGNDTLVPIALILNELITNSLKHAFTGQSQGQIDVEIRKIDKEDYFSFVYKDSGVWKTKAAPNSFGLELIATLIEQLDGDVERTYENGTKYSFILRDLLRDLK